MRHVSVAILLFSIACLTSCAHLMHLDRAQNQFNQAATLENQLRFNLQSEVLASPSLYYNSAYAAVNKALGNKGALSKDNVLANAYTIKALCEWKLNLHDQAEKSADDALAEYLELERNGILMPRDKGLMQALPYLVNIDKAKNKLYKFHAESNISFEVAKNHYLTELYDPAPDKTPKLEEALQKLSAIRTGLQGNEDLAVYLVLAQLAGLKTWNDGLDFLRVSFANDGGLDGQAKIKAKDFIFSQQDQAIRPAKEDLFKSLRALLPEEQANSLVAFWDKRI